jgi:predicted nuclease of predicted toxin-antitoxin system
MKFIVDAQLPRRLALELAHAGHDAIHTLSLDRGNRTSDRWPYIVPGSNPSLN